MGTNYYVAKNLCECCNRYDDDYHIGKSSGGWSFSFQGYKYENLTSWKQWKEFLKDQIIIDEYGETMPYAEFVEMIETVKSPNYVWPDGRKNKVHNEEGRKDSRPWFDPKYDWDDKDGYSFTTKHFS
jgi:hypothetical protein